jgi:hypothetical protein
MLTIVRLRFKQEKTRRRFAPTPRPSLRSRRSQDSAQDGANACADALDDLYQKLLICSRVAPRVTTHAATSFLWGGWRAKKSNWRRRRRHFSSRYAASVESAARHYRQFGRAQFSQSISGVGDFARIHIQFSALLTKATAALANRA